MIEKQRLQELIEKEEIVWCASELWGSNKLKLHNKDVMDSDCFHISKTLLLSDSIEFYDEEETYRVPFQLLFETEQEWLKYKSEAEWVAKMHAQRPDFFEPPIYEEWLKKEIFEFYSKDHKNYAISVCLEFDFFESPAKDYIEITNVNDFDHNKLFCAEKTKENYIKACEYARDLFLGKETANETNSNK